MALSNDLVSQFVRLSTPEPEKKAETTVYGTVRIVDGKTYVRIDGSGIDTPVSESNTTSTVNHDDRVMVLIKDHSAIITGNMTSPSATQKNLDETKDDVESKLTSFDKVVANKVDTETFKAEQAKITELQAKNVEITGQLNAAKADIETLEADNVTIKGTLTAHDGQFDTINAKFVTVDGELQAAKGKFETLEATDADFRTLESDYADFKNVNADFVEATKADIEDLQAENATITGTLTAHEGKFETVDADFVTVNGEIQAAKGKIETLESDYGEFKEVNADVVDAETGKFKKLSTQYTTIDFANINQAAVEKLFTDSGIIKDLTVSEGKITGELVGVTIKGDLIEGNTIKADKLVVKGSDGIYYKLNVEGGATTSEQVSEEDLQNGLSGSIIVAKSITAEKVAVDDLVAFDATIGGFQITNSAIYSDVKNAVDSPIEGVYLDKDGQIAIGDDTRFLKYYKRQNGERVLEISADEFRFGTAKKKIDDVISDIETGVSNAQTSADGAKTTADAAKTTADGAAAGIELLEGQISTLVQDENGQSLMTQTANGWVFNTSEIQKQIDAASNAAERVSMAETEIQLLMGQISMLVQDENGQSLMTQTADGWVYSTSEIQKQVDSASNLLNEIVARTGSAEAAIATLSNSVDEFGVIAEYVHIGSYTYTDENGTEQTEPSIDLYETDTGFKLKITNTRILFTDGVTELVSIDSKTKALTTPKATVESELQIGANNRPDGVWIWKQRANGNLGLVWKGATS